MHKLYARGVHPATSWRNDAVVRSGATANASAARHLFNSVNIRDQTKLIRERLLKEYLFGGLVYLESGEELLRNGSDVFHTFRADSNFLYVSGINLPGFACILDMESGTFTLLAPRLPPEAAFWMGGLPSLDELASEYGADRCAFKDELPVLLKRGHEMKGRTIHTTSTLASRVQNVIDDTKLQSNDSAMLTSSGRTASSLTIGTAPHGGDVASSNDSSTISSSSRVIGGLLEYTLARCRAIKTDAEVACLLEANIASGQAHKAIWRACHPGLMEYQLEAEFRRTAAYSGCLHVGYPSIVGSGPNSAILHYMTLQRQVCPGDLVLVDAGAEHRGYTADISRTFPASGIYSQAQKDLYNVVLAAQEHALQSMTEGAIMSDIEVGARKVLMEGMRDMGLVHGSVEELIARKVDRVFMPHGISHFLGLDVHDVSGIGTVPEELAAGNVITCEPGLYFIKTLIEKAVGSPETVGLLNMDLITTFMDMGGVRIEDDVLILKGSGNCNLTICAEVPKATSEIEDIMRGHS